MTNSMILVTGELHTDKKEFIETFKMVPISKDCPYNEVIFDVEKKVLFIISKEKKLNIHREQKTKDIIIDKYYEYMLHIPTDIINFVSLFSTNTAEFDFKKFMV